MVTITVKNNSSNYYGSVGDDAKLHSSSFDVTTNKRSTKDRIQSITRSNTAMSPRVRRNDFLSVRPKAELSIRTLQPPLPKCIPYLKQIKAHVIYEFYKRKYVPSVVETTAHFGTAIGDFYVKPKIEFLPSFKARSSSKPSTRPGSSTIDLEILFSRGSSFISAYFSGKSFGRAAGARANGKLPYLKILTGSFFSKLPYSTLQTIQLTPRLDLSASYPEFSCLIEAVTGVTGRTKAVLNLEYENPTLAIVHQIDERNMVAPEISIYNARITYQWDCMLSYNGLSKIRTKVDPLHAIYITWTDESALDGGTWVTNVRLPFERTTVSALAADVRIQRKFRF